MDPELRAIVTHAPSVHRGKRTEAGSLSRGAQSVQGAGYSERVMVIYDGLHYDALAVAAYAGAPGVQAGSGERGSALAPARTATGAAMPRGLGR